MNILDSFSFLPSTADFVFAKELSEFGDGLAIDRTSNKFAFLFRIDEPGDAELFQMETERGWDPFLAEDMATNFADRWLAPTTHASLLIHRHFATTVTEELKDLQASWVGQRL